MNVNVSVLLKQYEKKTSGFPFIFSEKKEHKNRLMKPYLRVLTPSLATKHEFILLLPWYIN